MLIKEKCIACGYRSSAAMNMSLSDAYKSNILLKFWYEVKGFKHCVPVLQIYHSVVRMKQNHPFKWTTFAVVRSNVSKYYYLNYLIEIQSNYTNRTLYRCNQTHNHKFTQITVSICIWLTPMFAGVFDLIFGKTVKCHPQICESNGPTDNWGRVKNLFFNKMNRTYLNKTKYKKQQAHTVFLFI